jgi:hypothetical protein
MRSVEARIADDLALAIGLSPTCARSGGKALRFRHSCLSAMLATLILRTFEVICFRHLCLQGAEDFSTKTNRRRSSIAVSMED